MFGISAPPPKIFHSTSLYRLGHSLPPPPVAKSKLRSKRKHGGEERDNGTRKERAIERKKSTRNVQPPLITGGCSDAGGPDIHEILAVLQHLEKSTNAPIKGLRPHRFFKPVAVPPRSAAIGAKRKGIETVEGEDRGRTEENMWAPGGEQQIDESASPGSTRTSTVQPDDSAITRSSLPSPSSSSLKQQQQQQPAKGAEVLDRISPCTAVVCGEGGTEEVDHNGSTTVAASDMSRQPVPCGIGALPVVQEATSPLSTTIECSGDKDASGVRHGNSSNDGGKGCMEHEGATASAEFSKGLRLADYRPDESNVSGGNSTIASTGDRGTKAVISSGRKVDRGHSGSATSLLTDPTTAGSWVPRDGSAAWAAPLDPRGKQRPDARMTKVSGWMKLDQSTIRRQPSEPPCNARVIHHKLVTSRARQQR